MNFFEVIDKRKSVRKFIPDRKISDSDLVKILEAVNLAPSAKNLQSYKVYMVRSRNKIGKLAQYCRRQDPEFIPSSSAILVFCSDPKNISEYFGERGEKLFSLQDATIACTFAMLQATSLGYASCWVGSFQEEGIKKVLKTKLTPLAMLVIGVGVEQPERKPRKSLKELVKFI